MGCWSKSSTTKSKTSPEAQLRVQAPSATCPKISDCRYLQTAVTVTEVSGPKKATESLKVRSVGNRPTGPTGLGVIDSSSDPVVRRLPPSLCGLDGR